MLERLDGRPPAECARGGHGAETDRPATEHGHVVAGLDAAEAADGVEGAAERLDGGALLPGQLVGQAVGPVGAILKRSAAAPLIEKPKWSAPPLTVHSPTMRSPGRTLRTSGPTATTSPDHS